MWRVINKNKYIEKNLCVTLVIHQEVVYRLTEDCKKKKVKNEHKMKRTIW